MRAEDACLVVVDVQARLAPAIAGVERAIAATRLLLAAAARLGVPVIVTEQNPDGIGASVPEIAGPAAEAGARVVAKTRFAATAEPAFRDALDATGRSQVVIAGTEAHVCVLQTAMGLLDAGHAVFVAADAVASRAPESREIALARLARAGCSVVTAEMVAFEWLARSDTPVFRALLPAIKRGC
ncbi:MAG: isochorismatase family protein [Paracoccaceae bacterium]